MIFHSNLRRTRWYAHYTHPLSAFSIFVVEKVAGTAEESFVAKWLKRDLSPSAQNELMYAAGSMFGGGGETVSVHL